MEKVSTDGMSKRPTLRETLEFMEKQKPGVMDSRDFVLAVGGEGKHSVMTAGHFMAILELQQSINETIAREVWEGASDTIKHWHDADQILEGMLESPLQLEKGYATLKKEQQDRAKKGHNR